MYVFSRRAHRFAFSCHVLIACRYSSALLVRLFGTTAAPPPPVLKALPKIFAHTDKTVRAEGTQLTHILYQYIGPGIDPWLAELKPVQVKELTEAFAALDADGKGRGSLKPERLTRKAAREAEAKAAVGEPEGDDEGPAEGASYAAILHIIMTDHSSL